MADDEPIRDELGRFVSGVSGNPKGRIPVPSRTPHDRVTRTPTQCEKTG